MQWLLIALPDRKDEAMPSLKNAIENLTKEQLVELLRMASKNLVAMDGTWFQILEEREGMDYAMEIDIAVWERYPISEARHLKKFLNLAEYPGLEGLAQALPLYYTRLRTKRACTGKTMRSSSAPMCAAFNRPARARAWNSIPVSQLASTNTPRSPRRSTRASR